MKRLIMLVIAMLAIVSMALPVSASTYVRGYYRSNGTYVSPHYRSSPNSNFYDNWSTQGNYNPYTGSQGYRTTPSYNYNPYNYNYNYNYNPYSYYGR